VDRMKGMRNKMDKFGKRGGNPKDRKFGKGKGEDLHDLVDEKFDELEEELDPRLEDKDGKKQDVLKKLKNLKESKMKGRRF